MEVIAIMALVFSACNLFLLAYLLGRQAGRRLPPVQSEEEPETEKRAREKLQAGMESIMGYDVRRGFMGDE